MNILQEILSFNQKQIIEQAKFTYSPLGKVFEKQTKIDWRLGTKISWCFKILRTFWKAIDINKRHYIKRKVKRWNYKWATINDKILWEF